MNRLLVILTLLGLFAACAQDPVLKQQSIRLDLTACFGPRVEANTMSNVTCGREKVSAIIDNESEANGCLVLKRDDQAEEHHRLRWENGRLSLLTAVVLDQPLTSQLQANLILYAETIDRDACEAQSLTTQCRGQCIVRLRDVVTVTSAGTETITVDFRANATSESGCDINWNDDVHPSLEELCDGIDNNCNGLIDEPEQCCTRHEDCQTELADLFCDPILLECVGCKENSDCENKFERRTFCNVETGRCGECDPGGDARATDRCPTDRPRCVTEENGLNLCKFCDPNTAIAESGCSYDRPCFEGTSRADSPYCARCDQSSDCPDPTECLLLPTPSNPLHGSCQECAPVNSGRNERCVAIHSNASPYCSERGKCVPCLPGTQDESCDESMPYCLPTEDADYACSACTSDLDCINLSPQEPYCDPNRNRCFTCRPGTRDGCSGSTPICNEDGASCRPCLATDECGTGTCVMPTDAWNCNSVDPSGVDERCRQIGQCRECDLEESNLANPNENCTEPTRPICRGNTCIGCETNADCPEETPSCNYLGQCTQCPIPYAIQRGTKQVEYRCEEDGNAPICSLEGTCQPCVADDDCLRRPGTKNICENGECRGCRDDAINGCTDPSKPICDIRDNEAVCVECLDSSDCRDGFSCTDFACIGGCNPVTQTGCDADQPVCTDRADCRFCTLADCQSNSQAIATLCANKTACRLCLESGEVQGGAEPGMRPDEEPAAPDAGLQIGVTPAEREPAYGCSETSHTPICKAGACVGCRSDDECAARPGLSNYCLRTGFCASCIPNSGLPSDEGCEANGRSPYCIRDDNGYRCVQCRDRADCPDGLTCTNGQCEVCDLETHAGCPDEFPICREVDGAIRCAGCEINSECRTKECRNQPDCLSSASCHRESQTCIPCNPAIPCLDKRACNGRECVPCEADDQCGDPEFGLRCNENGLCAAPACSPDRPCDGNFFNCDDGACWFCEPGTLCNTGQPCVYGDNFPIPICMNCRDAACPPDFACEFQTGNCVPE